MRAWHACMHACVCEVASGKTSVIEDTCPRASVRKGFSPRRQVFRLQVCGMHACVCEVASVWKDFCHRRHMPKGKCPERLLS